MRVLRLGLLLPVCMASLIAANCHKPPPEPASASSQASPEAGYALADLDKDGDGHVSMPELREAAVRKFNELDRDRSGTIDVKRECKERFASFCKKADVNGDGQITREEFVRHAEVEFQKADQDKNLKLTRQELDGVSIFRW